MAELAFKVIGQILILFLLIFFSIQLKAGAQTQNDTNSPWEQVRAASTDAH